ncbi:outer membrane beta-barrel protein [Corallococcus sp. ZKHCc1 1396]|uniref:Outer membrane beta-barrel protein n=2 Tax=Corallococcus soli TaxID=2710757 RepID=A0ABR9PYY8_9BACT|nr:outer membrane beta-barrel protein [Corallococcus soli]
MSAVPGPALLVVASLLLAAPRASAQPPAPEAPPPEAPIIQLSEEGFSLSSGDKAFVVKLRGQLQADGRFFVDDPERNGTNTFVMRRVRPILDGTFFGFVDFRFMPDFGSAQPLVQDAWIDFHPSDKIRLRAGKFKTPFGLELLQAAVNTPFIERSLTVDLVPIRDVGLELHGNVLGGRLQYSVAALNGEADGVSSDLNTDDGFDLAARLFVQPFKAGGPSLLKGLGVGFAVTRGQQFGTPGSASTTGVSVLRSTGQEILFNYLTGAGAGATVTAYGEHLRYSPQGYFYVGPLGLLAEYVSSSQEVRVGDARARLRHQAWQALASWVVFGGDAAYDGVKPTTPFDPETGRGGALEVAVRYHALDLDDDAFPLFADPTKSVTAAKGFGVGANWYFNKRVRFGANFHRTDYEGGATEGDRAPENVFITRFQVAF